MRSYRTFNEETGLPTPESHSKNQNILKAIFIFYLLLIPLPFIMTLLASRKSTEDTPIKDVEKIEDEATHLITCMEKGLEAGIKDVCKIPVVLEICRESLGQNRSDDPQVPKKVVHRYLKRKAMLGYLVIEGWIHARSLATIQGEFDAAEILRIVTGARDHTSKNPCDHPAIVSICNPDKEQDEYAVDGETHVKACHILNGTQRIFGVCDTVENMLNDFSKEPGVTYTPSLFKPPKIHHHHKANLSKIIQPQRMGRY